MESQYSGLGASIVGRRSEGEEGSQRRQSHDMTLVTLDHGWHELATSVKVGKYVDVEGLLDRWR